MISKCIALGLFIAIVSSVQSQLPDSCFNSQVQSQDCTWYVNCLGQKYQCGKEGYPIGYGFKYCVKFSQLKSFSVVRGWVERTTICLKEKLLPLLRQENPLDCHELKKKAFKSHPVCYDDAGFCHLFTELGFYDSTVFLKQLLQLYDLKDFESLDAVKQIQIMAQKCIREIGASILKKWSL